MPRHAGTVVVTQVRGRFSEPTPFPPRFKMAVRYFLDEYLLEAWIGGAEPTPWILTFRTLSRATSTYCDLRKISITTSDATVPSGASRTYFTRHSQSR
jgi:hypothetical protein